MPMAPEASPVATPSPRKCAFAATKSAARAAAAPGPSAANSASAPRSTRLRRRSAWRSASSFADPDAEAATVAAAAAAAMEELASTPPASVSAVGVGDGARVLSHTGAAARSMHPPVARFKASPLTLEARRAPRAALGTLESISVSPTGTLVKPCSRNDAAPVMESSDTQKSDVAEIACGAMAVNEARAGMIMMPPPIPHKLPSTPATTPVGMATMAGIDGLGLAWELE